MGRKVRAMMSSPKMLGFRTSMTALNTSWMVDRPFPASLRCRWTFSTWMMVASMIMPMQMASPPSEMRLAVRPALFMTVKVSRAESGRARMTTNAPRTLLRKRKRMMTTRMDPTRSAPVTVSMLLTMMSERL